ncbi:MAG: S9 family peptidase [Candidatus Eremiobacteraeota bacterium]|nr:S9 family peptidase [Candidatus Eremiobacteraeota bacterium]
MTTPSANTAFESKRVPQLDLEPVPPRAERRPSVTFIHGETRTDEYSWLREDGPDVTAYLEAENAYAEAVLAPTIPLQSVLYDEMLSHVKQTDLSVPYRLGAYLYYSRTEEGKQYPIFARRRDPEAAEEITLDLNLLAEGREFLGLGSYEISDDGRLLAYALDVTGYRQYTLAVKDVRTGASLLEAIARVTSVVWAASGTTLFYTTEDAVSKRRDRFWRRDLGASASVLVYEEPDELYDIGTTRSRDRAYTFLVSASKSTTEWRALRSDSPEGELTVVLPRSEGHRAGIEHYGDRFYILTNRDAADFRLVTTPEASTDEEHWHEVVPERAGVHLEDLEIFERYAVLRGRSGGFANLEVLELATETLHAVDLPETVRSVQPNANPEFVTDAFRFTYTSLVTPPAVFDLDMRTRERTLLKETEVPGYDRALYATELRHATAPDGTRVPISLVYRTEGGRPGPAPMLLYAYGSYGLSMDPSFSAARLALLDRGVTFAIAHVRGGGELGEAWRTSGHLQNKLNTFTDFIAVAEYVVAEGLTSSDRLAIQGGSAGGLLVGAVSNMRPELFAAVVSQVPFVDVVNTMLDASLPLTTAEYLEWGNPNVASDYAYMMRYSPYDNVRAQPYPATLTKVSINDSQVPYWEGAKLTARLRAATTGRQPLLLVTNFGAGHGGPSGRYDHLRDVAAVYAFVLAKIAS